MDLRMGLINWRALENVAGLPKQTIRNFMEGHGELTDEDFEKLLPFLKILGYTDREKRFRRIF